MMFFIRSTGFDQQVSVAILRVAEGLDYSTILAEIELTGVNSQMLISPLDVLQRSSSTSKPGILLVLRYRWFNMAERFSIFKSTSFIGFPLILLPVFM